MFGYLFVSITHIVTFLTQLSPNLKRSSRRSEFTRDILDDTILDLLVKIQKFTLPAGRSLLAQLGKQFNGTATLQIGSNLAAAAVNSLVKVAATALSQNTLSILFKTVDYTLSEISATKLQLKTLSSGICEDPSVDSIGEAATGLKRRRSRGKVLILILTCTT